MPFCHSTPNRLRYNYRSKSISRNYDHDFSLYPWMLGDSCHLKRAHQSLPTALLQDSQLCQVVWCLAPFLNFPFFIPCHFLLSSLQWSLLHSNPSQMALYQISLLIFWSANWLFTVHYLLGSLSIQPGPFSLPILHILITQSLGFASCVSLHGR